MKGERESAGKRWRQTAVFLCCYFERLAAALLPWSGPAYFCPGLVLLLFLAPERERAKEREIETARLGRVTERESVKQSCFSYLCRGREAGTELWRLLALLPARGTDRETPRTLHRTGPEQRTLGRWSSSYAADHLWIWLQHQCRVEEETPGLSQHSHGFRYSSRTLSGLSGAPRGTSDTALQCLTNELLMFSIELFVRSQSAFALTAVYTAKIKSFCIVFLNYL